MKIERIFSQKQGVMDSVDYALDQFQRIVDNDRTVQFLSIQTIHIVDNWFITVIVYERGETQDIGDNGLIAFKRYIGDYPVGS